MALRTWSVISSLPILLFLAERAHADDWPQYRGDAARTARTEEALPATLNLQWTFKLRHAPQPAWPDEDRMVFDRSPLPVAANGTVFIGCSVTGKVLALEAKSGRVKWTFFTEGPVRMAPAAWRDRVFAASDDGHLYCLAAADGKLLWKKRGGPDDRKVLGNDRMVSRWPARGGPVVLDNTVYYGAGIWPSDGIYLYALDARTGKQRWLNDGAGAITMPQPHGGANAKSGVSAQGHFLARGEHLFVPTGRAVPAAFDRKKGKFAYFRLQENGAYGGSDACLIGPYLFNGERRAGAYDPGTGALIHRFRNGSRISVAALPEGFLLSDSKRLSANRWVEKEKPDRKGNPVKVIEPEAEWKLDVPGGLSMIVAGGTAIVGAPGKISAVDLESRKATWSAEIEGAPYGLAASNGRLIVGTDRGLLYCFGEDTPSGKASTVAEASAPPSPAPGPLARKAAEEIVRKTGVTEGYCLDLACGDGALAYELARTTKLRIIAIDKDPKNVARARRTLDAAGLYGARVTVHLGNPSKTPYPKNFANLIVSGRSMTKGPRIARSSEVSRLQRPYGGTVCLGRPGSMKKKERGPLKKAGSWTHQYGNPANTCSSDDQIVKGRLRMYWWRQVDILMPQRHGRGPAPLFHEGRMFVEGMHLLRAVDAYNGRTLWEYPLKDVLKAYNQEHLVGTALTGSNFCVGGTASTSGTEKSACGSMPPPAGSSGSSGRRGATKRNRGLGVSSPSWMGSCSDPWPTRPIRCGTPISARRWTSSSASRTRSSRWTPKPESSSGSRRRSTPSVTTRSRWGRNASS